MSHTRPLAVLLLITLAASGYACANPYGGYRYGQSYDGRYANQAFPVYQPFPHVARRVPHNRNPAYYPGYAYPEPSRPGGLPTQGAVVAGLQSQAATEISNRINQPAAQQPAVGTTGSKQAFIASLLPTIERENRRLLVLRKTVGPLLDKLDAGGSLGQQEQQQIKELAQRYRVKQDPLTIAAARSELLCKIDIIPSSLALAQAANESGWGQSRFAQEANNLFGIWTYDKDKGLKPKNREQGKQHLVRIFDDVSESVRYYMHTLNSHPAYAGLREIREELRTAGQTIDGQKLAAGLERYSAKGQQYIDLIRSLIRQNKWAGLDMHNQSA
ncbi:MAG: glucosaminidase domain-containing protein [Pseudomonadota bacterium]